MHGRFGVLGGGDAPDLGDPVVDLDVEALHAQSARVLADPGADALLDLFLLLGDIPPRARAVVLAD